MNNTKERQEVSASSLFAMLKNNEQPVDKSTPHEGQLQPWQLENYMPQIM